MSWLISMIFRAQAHLKKFLEPQDFSLVHNDSCEVVAWYLWVQNKMQFHYDQIIKSYVPLTDEQFCGCSGECKVLQVIILLEWIIFLFRRSNFRFKRCVSFKFWITNFIKKYVPYHLPILDPKIIKTWNYISKQKYYHKSMIYITFLSEKNTSL